MTPDQFLLISDPLPEPTLLLSGDGLILAANRAVGQSLGIQGRSILGKTLAEIVREPASEVAHYLRLCCGSRNLVLGALTFLGPNNLTRACRAEGALIRPRAEGSNALLMMRLLQKESATGKFVALNQRIDELANEVHRRKYAEEAARQQAETMRVTLYSIGDGVISTDANSQVVMMNPVAESLTGWSMAEAAGCTLDSIFNMVHEITRAPLENPAVRALREDVIVDRRSQALLIDKDGRERPIDHSAAPIRDVGGNVVGSVFVFRDITESQRAELELGDSKRRFQAVFNQQFQFMAILDKDGKVLESNETIFQVTGAKREQFLSRPLWEAAWWENLPAMRQQWKRNVSEAALGGGPVSGDMEYSLADGTIRHAKAVVTGVRDESGRITNILLEAHDDTERRRSETILVTQKKVLELLVSGEPLSDVLDAICEVIEGENPRQIVATILLLDEDGQRLHTVAGRRAPPEYSRALESVEIGPNVGSCGTAAYRAEQVIVSDIATDPLWANYRELALAHGLKACWSTPIISSIGKVLGTFAVYYRTSGRPSNDEMRLVDILTRTAGIAIERRRGEEAVRFQARLLDTFGQAAIVTDMNEKVIYWNRFAETLYGWSKEEVLGQKASELLAAPQSIATNEEKSKRLRAGENWSGELEVCRRDGTTFHAFVTDTPVLDEEKEVSAIIGISFDISERIQLEKSLRFLADASASLAELVDFEETLKQVAGLAVPHFADWCAVDLLESDGGLRRLGVAHVDEEKIRLAQELDERYPPRQDVDFGVYHVLRTGFSEMMTELPDSILAQAAADDEHLAILRELGLKSYMCVPLQARGKTIGVITFVTAESDRPYTEGDLAFAEELARRSAIAIENAQLYQELRDADRRKDEFLATLAHELRNPLAPIRNGLLILRLSGSESPEFIEVRSMMERQLNQMVRLVDDLLDVSRITRNKIDLRKQRVELAAVIHSACETSRPRIEEAGHAFSVTLPPIPVYLNADQTRLAQVFSNLLNNSAKYTQPGGSIALDAEVSGNEVIVRVSDDGMGIPAESLNCIFDVFSQVDRNMGRSQGGLGIGLTLVRRLVEMHEGTVLASSQGPDQGSVFSVRLPVFTGPNADQLSPQLGDGNSTETGRKILIVDDNVDAAMSLGMMLKLLGNETRMAHDGLAAVAAAAEFRPDLLLLDIGLPELNGYDVCRRIREQPWSEHLVIVALTGWGQDQDRRQSAEAGFNHHMVKPVDFAALKQLLVAPPSRSLSVEDFRSAKASLRVLVVDDMRDATLMLGTLLKKAGHDIRTASNGPAALEAVIEHRPEAVLLDINMPGMSGIEVAKQIRQLPDLGDIMLIAMTGHGEEADRQLSLEAGFDHHLVKPADIQVLRDILATVKSNPGEQASRS